LSSSNRGHASWTNRFAAPPTMHSFVADLALDAADKSMWSGCASAESIYDYVTIKYDDPTHSTLAGPLQQQAGVITRVSP